MRRRTLLATGAAALAAPAISRAADARTLRFVPEADLAILDPVWTTTAQTVQHAFLIYDTLWGQDAQFQPAAANARGPCGGGGRHSCGA